ncbi:alanine--tRNA ligase-related protein [Candidatus Portiera aleyrodidarum]|uniref:Alanine--tRNA ligase n=1 Tax=Candidatus Portiera aleyrodidarum TaxID=91844 RepID=A0A8D9JSQ3_9GAMM|nr:alanine--tRNA ligase-related protein [Candidatus Portiera aleyrodidarum]CEI58763.1 Alanyl-tRNA editing protein [Candidatus Portiera aleyrodidarum]
MIFKLYDTYGLPYDLIKYFLTENNIKFDNLGFKKEMINYKFKSKKKYLLNTKIVNIDKKNYLINFNIYKYKTNISFIFDKNGKNINFINEKNNGFILLNKTSFFFESCGQVGDVGYIYNDLGKFKVKNVIKYKNLYLHIGVLLKGILFINNKVNIYIDKLYRYKIKKNHSATHLLNETLKRVLNVNLIQKSSLINNKNLTFDFNYHKNISNEKLFIIEKLINNEILKNNIIFIKKLSLKKINKIKAVALVENKYLKEKLNVVFIGKKNSYSIEVCDGLHVESTNKIGVFCIILEKSISKGIRRIEALTDKNAICYLLKNKLLINNVSDIFKQNIYNIKKNILNIINKKNELIDNLREIKNININFFIKKLLKKILYLYNYRILIEKIKIYYKNDLYLIINNLINKLFNKSIIIIYIKINNNINLFIRLTNDFLKKKLNSKIILNKLFINNKNIIYSKKNIFSYISTNKKNVKNLNLIKNILKNILKLY